ncbi:MAG: XrtA/PEP-CTERM system TPR-repeat protein PrsT [Gammaproteobacteria bacterium]
MKHRRRMPTPTCLPNRLKLIASAALLALCLQPTAPIQAAITSSESGWYEQALSDFHKRDYEGATRSVQFLLRKEPKNLPGRILLGRINLKMGNAAAAEKELRRARAEGGDRNLIYPILGDAYLLQAKYDEILRELKPEGLSQDARSEVLALRGKTYLAQRDLVNARQVFEQIAEEDPYSAESHIGLARIDLSKGNYDEAERLVDEALKRDDENTDALQFKAEAQWKRGENESALEVLNKALDLDPDHMGARLSRAGVLMDLGSYEKALDDAEFVTERIPHDAQAIFMKSQVLRKMGRSDEAQQLLIDASAVLRALSTRYINGHSPSLLLLGLIETEQRNWEAATNYLQRYVKLNPFHVGGRKLYGQALLERGQTLTAEGILEPLVDYAPDDPSVYAMLGKLYMSDQRYEKGEEMWSKAVELEPENASFRLRLGLAKMATGKHTNRDAIKELEKAIELDPENKSLQMMLGHLYLRQKNNNGALRMAEAELGRIPDNISALNLKGAALIRLDRMDEARDTFNQILRAEPRNEAARLNLARIEINLNKPAAATEHLQAVLRYNPQNEDALYELSQISLTQEDVDGAITWLEKARDQGADSPRLGARLVNLYLSKQDLEKADALSDKLIIENRRNLDMMLLRAKVEVALGEMDKAKSLYRNAATLASERGATEALAKVGREQANMGDLDQAQWSLNEILRAEPGHFSARISLAEIEIRRDKAENALEIAQSLANSHPQFAVGHRLMGDAYMAQERYRDAVIAYQRGRAVEATAFITRRLFKAMIAAGDSTGAETMIRDWVAQKPGDVVARQLLVGRMLQRGDWKAATPELEILLAERPNDPAILNNLAWAYFQAEDDRAQGIAERALAESPDDANTLDTLGWILVKKNDLQAGLRYLREAHSRDSRAPQIRYHIASTLAALGRTTEARRELRKLLRGDEDFASREDARYLLDQISSN